MRAAAFVGLNPLLLVHVVGGPHNDGLAMLLAMLGVAAVLGAAEASGGAAFVLAAGIKASGAFAMPFALLGTGVRRGRFLLGAGGGVRAAGADRLAGLRPGLARVAERRGGATSGKRAT